MAEFLHSNVDPSAVTWIEQQTRAVSLDEDVAMASVLGVPPAAPLTDDFAHEMVGIEGPRECASIRNGRDTYS